MDRGVGKQAGRRQGFFDAFLWSVIYICRDVGQADFVKKTQKNDHTIAVLDYFAN